MTDEELAGWARNWHWNDCAEDKPVDPSIYFRDMRMLKAFIAAKAPQCEVQSESAPTNRQLHDAIAEALSGTPTYSRVQEAVREIQKLYAGAAQASLDLDAMRETIRRALIDARCTSRDTTVVNDGMTNVLNVVVAALSPLTSAHQNTPTTHDQQEK